MVFLEWCVDELTEAGETRPRLSNFDKREAVHGYSYSDHDGRPDLITSYKKSTEPYTIQKSEIETLTKNVVIC